MDTESNATESEPSNNNINRFECFVLIQIVVSIEAASEERESQPIVNTNEDHSYVKGAYWVVQFFVEDNNTIRKWLGKIKTVSEDGTIFMSFLRGKRTKDYSGYIYTKPVNKDRAIINKSQMLYEVPPPQKYQRALKFVCHCDHL